MKRLLLSALAICLLLSGCGQGGTDATASSDVPVSSAAASSGALSLPDGYTGVKAYWSTLPTSYDPPQPLYTRYAEHTDRLTPQDDYGVLLPYAGRLLALDNYIIDKLPMYGLVTGEGKIVTDPVYSDIWRQGNFLILLRPEILGTHKEDWGTALDGKFQRTFAAPDGSWVREPDDSVGAYAGVDDSHLALYRTNDTILILDDADSITCTFDGADIRAALGTGYPTGTLASNELESPEAYIDWCSGIGCLWLRSDYENDPEHYQFSLYLNTADGSISRTLPAGSNLSPPNDIPSDGSYFAGYGYTETVTDPVTQATYYVASRSDGSGKLDLLDQSGAVLLSDYNVSAWSISPYWVWDGLIPAVRSGYFCYYRTDGTCIFRYPIQTNMD